MIVISGKRRKNVDEKTWGPWWNFRLGDQRGPPWKVKKMKWESKHFS